MIKFIFLFLALNALAHEESFLPRNDMEIGISTLAPTGLSEAEFNSVIDELSSIYGPIVSGLGATLTIEKEWKRKDVNAYAKQLTATDWRVILTGGFARHKLMTKDAFTLVGCHEMGHHLGGAPKTTDRLMTWSSIEGQADYFASMKCMRRLWAKEDNASIIANKIIPASLKEGCEGRWSNKEESNICIRTGMAGLEIGALLASMNRPGSPYRRTPKIETPDQAEVGETSGQHPKPQCRVDTFYQGSICHVSYEIDFDLVDEKIGACEKSLGDLFGTRPACWYFAQK